MSTHLHPNDNYLIISFQELELAWRAMASPGKIIQIDDTLQTLQTLNKEAGPTKAVFTMIAATAWLLEDGYGSSVG